MRKRYGSRQKPLFRVLAVIMDQFGTEILKSGREKTVIIPENRMMKQIVAQSVDLNQPDILTEQRSP